MYHYFVSYNAVYRGNRFFGMFELLRYKKISSYAEIKDISKCLEEENGYEGVIILNYQLIRDEKY